MPDPIDQNRPLPWRRANGPSAVAGLRDLADSGAADSGAADGGVAAVTRSWVQRGQVRACLTAERLLPARDAAFAPRPPLHPGLERALDARGIGRLYTHQVQAIAAARAARHVIVATPTASGKSLCFHLPVLQALAEDPGATALFLYPTKALSRDQEHGLHALLRDAGISVPSIVFDGDTPGDARQKARQGGRIILTNPDMLHAGILPNHNRWGTFLQGLKYVVLDEMHTFRGVFGSHMAHVITRLKRLCAFHGSKPTFIGATATIGNPQEHASRLLGVDPSTLELVSSSGAPQSSRKVFIYNPPVVNQELGVRASSLKAAVRLAADMVSARVPTIIFGPSRNSVEVMLKYLRERCERELRGTGIDVKRAIMGYRGGYLPEMRRDIERGLRAGEILCVVATNALELGIDIGELDCVICAGYAGSVAGTWQRFGRAGRRGKQSALVLVCGSGAVDQYLARTPEYLLDGTSEQALIDPGNAEVLIQHLKCATFEAPFSLTAPGGRLAEPSAAAGDAYGGLGLSPTRDALEYLVGLGLVHHSGGRYHWAGEAFPASHVSLRNVGWDNFVIIEQGDLDPAEASEKSREKTLGELDYRATHTMLHEQAIYQQDAEQYQVERLDFDNHKAYVRRVEPDYFTTALTYRTVELLESYDERVTREAPPGIRPDSSHTAQAPEPARRTQDRAQGPEEDAAGPPGGPRPTDWLSEGWGDVKVLEKVTGYKKIKFFTHENAGYGDVHLPVMEMHTTAYWLRLHEPFVASFPTSRPVMVSALRGVGRALETVSSVALMCDPRDINQTLGDGGPQTPTLFLFDAHPGGVGLAERIYGSLPELLARARELIATCQCEAGCPACVGPCAEEPSASLGNQARLQGHPEPARRRQLALELIDRLGLAARREVH